MASLHILEEESSQRYVSTGQDSHVKLESATRFDE